MRRLLLPLLALLAPVAGARAQTPQAAGVPESRVCSLRVEAAGLTSREGELLHIHDPFRVLCNDGANLRANSGIYDQLAREVTLIGDVYFEDQTRTLTSDEAVYNNAIGMLHATGDVVFRDRMEGTTLEGPELEYYRANEQRAEALVNAMGRPRLTLTQRPGAEGEPESADDAGADTTATPVTIDADRLSILGRDDLSAFGNVVIEDAGMRAVADEAERRGSAETMELRGNAAIHSQEYSLEAETIYATLPGGSIGEVEALGEARLLGADLNVDAPRLDLFFQDDLLQRSIARSDSALAPGVRPVAASTTFRLEADSIDASLPGQKLETVVAIGTARGESIDTAAVEAAPDDSTNVAAAGPAESLGAAPSPGDTLQLGAAARADTAVVGVPAGQPGGIRRRVVRGDSVIALGAAQLVENDWITGDTITGFFASVVTTPGDSLTLDPEPAQAEESPERAGGAQAALDSVPAAATDTALVMERLVAVGAARSLYRVAPEEGSPPGTEPGVNFLSAARIELRFEDGQVQVADVAGLRRGLYLEPVAVNAEEGEDGEDAPAEGEGAQSAEGVDEGAGPPEGEELPPEDDELPPGEDELPPEEASPDEGSEP